MRPKEVDHAGFKSAVENSRRLQDRKNELMREFSDLNHRRQQTKVSGNSHRITEEVAGMLVGFDDDDAVATVDDSRDRLQAILREVALLEQAIHEQEQICIRLRLQVEREVRAKALPSHKELARKVLKHRAEGRLLRKQILAWEQEHLGSVPFGHPLEHLTDASDELRYGAMDDVGLDGSQLLEKRLTEYVK
jgi:hypothetical protein